VWFEQMEELHKELDLLRQELDHERETALKYFQLCSTLTYAVDEKTIELELEQKARRDALDALLVEKRNLEEYLANERASNQSNISELATQLGLLEAELLSQQAKKGHDEEIEAEMKKLKEECAIAQRDASDTKLEIQDLEMERDLAREDTERFRHVSSVQSFELAEKDVLLEFADKDRTQLEAQVAALKVTIEEHTEQHRKREEELSGQLAAVEQRLQEARHELAAERDARGEEQRLHAALRFSPSCFPTQREIVHSR
jgi:chromosome segregation ATPase